jgi:tRNA A22 N-methylase
MLWDMCFGLAISYCAKELKSRIISFTKTTKVLSSWNIMVNCLVIKEQGISYEILKDCINKKEVAIEHCGSQHMIGDFFTKPLQGALFYKYQKEIMNLEDPDGPDDAATMDSLQLHRSVLGKLKNGTVGNYSKCVECADATQ